LIYQEVLFIEESEWYLKKKAPAKGNSLHRGPVGEPAAGFVNRGLGETVKECSVNGVCLWELCEGNLEGGSFTGNSES
jgi:hypothetical protein